MLPLSLLPSVLSPDDCTEHDGQTTVKTIFRSRELIGQSVFTGPRTKAWFVHRLMTCQTARTNHQRAVSDRVLPPQRSLWNAQIITLLCVQDWNIHVH